MGLKCSVIGHKYGEASVEREREEQGSEVVITIQERETCERCGKTRIVSENKEVTAIETPSDIAGDMIDDESEDDAAEVAETQTEQRDEGDPEEPVESDDELGVASADAVEAVDPDADDAEILDDGADEPAGGDSELDDPSTVESVTETEEPVAEAEAVEDATDPETDDGVIIDGDGSEQAGDADREPGAWPEEPDSGGDDWKPETVLSDDDPEEEAVEESPDVEPLGGTAVTKPTGQFLCPECDFTTDVASSSLRAGDFCPECHKGALVNNAE